MAANIARLVEVAQGLNTGFLSESKKSASEHQVLEMMLYLSPEPLSSNFQHVQIW
jgi:hypothetical protein